MPLPSPSVPTSSSTPTRTPHRLFSLDRRPSPPSTASSSFMSNSSLRSWLWLALPYSTASGNPKLPLTLFTIWNCDSVNFPHYFTVRCPRQGLPWLPLAQLLGLEPAREEGPESCLLINGYALSWTGLLVRAMRAGIRKQRCSFQK